MDGHRLCMDQNEPLFANYRRCVVDIFIVNSWYLDFLDTALGSVVSAGAL